MTDLMILYKDNLVKLKDNLTSHCSRITVFLDGSEGEYMYLSKYMHAHRFSTEMNGFMDLLHVFFLAWNLVVVSVDENTNMKCGPDDFTLDRSIK